MTRLTEALESLADRGSPRGPDRVLPAARLRAAQMRRRRLAAMGGLAAAAVVVVAAVGLAVTGGDGGTRVESGLAATTDGGAPSTSRPAPDPATSVPATSAPGPTTTPPGTASTVRVFLLDRSEADCATTRAVERPVEGTAVLRAALDHLLEGPTPEDEAAGLTSWFSAATAGGVLSVDIVEGVALVDLRGDLLAAMPGVSTSCGSAGLFAQLDGTVTQFDGVERAVYSLDGDVAAFYESLEGSAPDGSSSTPEADGIAAWPGSVGLDPSGALDLGDFPDHLASVDPDHQLGMEAIASLLLHLEDQRAQGVIVLVEGLPEVDGERGLAVTLSNLGDDSVAELRYELRYTVGPGRPPTITAASWSQRCQPGRGHQDPSPELCV